MSGNNPYIHVTNLKKHYKGGIRALDGVDCDIEKGEVVVIIGPSGSGKSTFLRSLNLLEFPTDGEICVNGVNILGKNVDIERELFESFFKGFIVLSGQKGCRNNDGDLNAVHRRRKGRAQSDLRLAEADIAADKPIHRPAFA